MKKTFHLSFFLYSKAKTIKLKKKKSGVEDLFGDSLKKGDKLLKLLPLYAKIASLLKVFRYNSKKPTESVIMSHFCVFYVFLRRWTASNQSLPDDKYEKLLNSFLSYVEKQDIDNALQTGKGSQDKNLEENLHKTTLTWLQNTFNKTDKDKLYGYSAEEHMSFSTMLNFFGISFRYKAEDRYVISVPSNGFIPASIFPQTVLLTMNVYPITNSDDVLWVSNPVTTELRNLIVDTNSTLPSALSSSSVRNDGLSPFNTKSVTSLNNRECFSDMEEEFYQSKKEMDSYQHGPSAVIRAKNQFSTPTIFTKMDQYLIHDERYSFFFSKTIYPDQVFFLKGPKYHFFSSPNSFKFKNNNNINNNNNSSSDHILVPLSFRTNFNYKKNSPDDQASSYYWCGCMVSIVNEDQSFSGFVIFFRISPTLILVCNLCEDDFEDLPENNLIDLFNDEKCLYETTISGLKPRFCSDNFKMDLNELSFQNFQLANTDWCPSKHASVHFYRRGSNMKELN